MIYMNWISSYNYINYNFVTENARHLSDEIIEYGETNLNRTSNITEIYQKINDINKAIIIETSAFEFALVNCVSKDLSVEYIIPIYNDKIKNIILAIDKSVIFLNNIKKNKILSQIAFSPNYDFFSEKWEKTIKKKEIKEQHENIIVYSDAYDCYKCKESKCTIENKQTRGADEPMTSFIKCIVCGNAWKIN
jgi:DNA-directed RNA polymerase subunit M/transcription elongation factor TFIIS